MWFGLLPLALSHGMGAETQRPFAVAILFGCLVGRPALLVLLPVLEAIAERIRAFLDRPAVKRLRMRALVVAFAAVVMILLLVGLRAARAQSQPGPQPAATILTHS